MTAVRMYYLHCDGPNCKDWVRIAHPTLTEARKSARKYHDWRTRRVETFGGDHVIKDYCPRHKP